MQVDLVPSAGGRAPTSSVRAALTPDVLQLLTPSAATQARQRQNLEDRQEKLRRRDLERSDLVAQAAGAPRPSELMMRAEREMAPGSQAAQRQQWQAQLREQVQQRNSTSRQAANQAAGRDSPERSPAVGRAPGTSATDAKPAAASAAPSSGDRAVKASSPEATPSARTAARPVPGPLPAGSGSVRPVSFNALVSATSPPAGKVGPANQGGLRVTGITAAAATVKSAATPGSAAPRAPGGVPVAATAARTTVAGAKAATNRAGAAEAEPRSTDANVERIVRWVAGRMSRERAVTTLRLDPPDLGMVRVRMDLRNEQLGLDIETRTVAARKLLEDHVETLRRSLEASGVHLERVAIRALAPRADAAETNGSPQSGVWSDAGENRPRPDAEFAGGGLPGEPESPNAEPSAAVDGTAFAEPAAEPLVNILA